MEHLVALQGVVGLRHLGLGAAEHVAGLRGVHLGEELAAADGLSLVDIHTLDHAHAGEADGRAGVLLDNAYVGVAVVDQTGAHQERFYTRGGFLSNSFLLAAAGGQEPASDCQNDCVSHVFLGFWLQR